jgi:hypothetical protein
MRDAAARKSRSEPDFDIKLLTMADVSRQAAKSWLGSTPNSATASRRQRRLPEILACRREAACQLPARAACIEDQARAVHVIQPANETCAISSWRPRRALYGKLTNNRKNFVRVEQLCRDGAKLVPDSAHRKGAGGRSAAGAQGQGALEIDQGLFLAHVLAIERPAGISATPCCCRDRISGS